jgi:CheY-like chemotaxis protein
MHDNPSNTRAKILIVEDDDLLLEVLCRSLEAEGYEAHPAANGNEALEMIARTDYNTIVLDLVFRKKYIQGFDVLKAVHAASPRLPVVVMSGSASDETLVGTLLLGGAFSFLLKPVEPAGILDIVAEAVQKEKIGRHLSEAASEQDGDILIEGISSELHVFVKQYGAYFEQYLRNFKGVEAKVSFSSEFDTLRATFESTHAVRELQTWFREYLAFTEQYEPAHPSISTPCTAEQAFLYTGQLRLQIKHFASSVESAYWRNSVGLSEKPSVVEVVRLNPLKIVNGLQLNTRNAALSTRRLEAADVVNRATEYISAAETTKAFVLLIDFCNKYGEPFSGVKKEILILKYKLTRALNEKRLNFATVEACNQELDKVHNALVFDVLPALEDIALRGEAVAVSA